MPPTEDLDVVQERFLAGIKSLVPSSNRNVHGTTESASIGWFSATLAFDKLMSVGGLFFREKFAVSTRLAETVNLYCWLVLTVLVPSVQATKP